MVVKVDYLPPQESPELRDAVDALIEKNFESDLFISAAEADRETELYRQQLLQGTPILLSDQDDTIMPDKTTDEAAESSDPFS